MILLPLAVAFVLLSQTPENQKEAEEVPARNVELRVAVYAWLPEGASGIELLEEAFERKYKTIDLDIELFSSYTKQRNEYEEYKVLDSLGEFDIVEIDYVSLDKSLKSRLQPIPEGTRVSPNSVVGPAKPILKAGGDEWIVPHWVCGNFLVSRDKTMEATPMSWAALRRKLDATAGTPLLVDFHGTSTTGDLYADAVLDILGPELARKNLLGLASGITEVNEEAALKVLSLGVELPPKFRNSVSYWHNHPQAYPEAFSKSPNGMLLGYSERLYFVERELQLNIAGSPPPLFAVNSLAITQFSFSKNSQGTPSYMDGFVIPRKSRSDSQDSAIALFLEFIQTEEAYMAFIKPRMYHPASYLLPAIGAVYDSNEVSLAAPLLKRYRDVLGESFPIDAELYKGLRVAGKEIERRIDLVYLGDDGSKD